MINRPCSYTAAIFFSEGGSTDIGGPVAWTLWPPPQVLHPVSYHMNVRLFINFPIDGVIVQHALQEVQIILSFMSLSIRTHVLVVHCLQCGLLTLCSESYTSSPFFGEERNMLCMVLTSLSTVAQPLVLSSHCLNRRTYISSSLLVSEGFH